MGEIAPKLPTSSAEAIALPDLVSRAAAALSGASTHAEVLEARDMARVAYDAAKSAGRMQRAKAAHDALLAAVYRAQGHALLIEARAKMRLAEEYDAAQARGEVAGNGQRGPEKAVADANSFSPATAADLGLRRDEIHEARRLRDAEAAEPGVIERTVDEIVARGEEPTKARVRREMAGAAAPADPGRELTDDDLYRALQPLANLLINGFFDEWGAGAEDPPTGDLLWVFQQLKRRGPAICGPVARAAVFFRQMDEVINGKA